MLYNDTSSSRPGREIRSDFILLVQDPGSQVLSASGLWVQAKSVSHDLTRTVASIAQILTGQPSRPNFAKVKGVTFGHMSQKKPELEGNYRAAIARASYHI